MNGQGHHYKCIDCTTELTNLCTVHSLLDASSINGGHSSTSDSPLPGRSFQAVGGTKHEGCTALELLNIEQDLDHIVTFSASIDGMLGGGVPVGKITEFCGSPGIGKTQLRWAFFTALKN